MANSPTLTALNLVEYNRFVTIQITNNQWIEKAEVCENYA